MNYKYSEIELKEYQKCPEVLFTGCHIAGLRSCPFCAEIFRRYHMKEMELAEETLN